jgi:hypothetical protein
MSLLVQGRKITADATKRGHSGVITKRPGDLLLDFDHAKIPLRQIVVLWKRELCYYRRFVLFNP